MRTVLGSISGRPGSEDVRKIGSFSWSTATGVSIFFEQMPGPFSRYEIRFYDVEKPSSAVAILGVVISTNGATFESGAVYDYSRAFFTATTALTATGATGQFVANLHTGTFSMATATNRQGGGWGVISFDRCTGTNVFPRFSWEWHFLNSASSPVYSFGNGFVATGPLRGVQISSAAGANSSGKADIYGIGHGG